MCVGAIAKLLSPRTVFEFGTYNGRTTAMFVLKADATVLMLGLAEGDVPQNLFQSDRELAARLRTGYILRDLGRDGRYRQLLVDSLQFDPEPHLGLWSLDLWTVAIRSPTSATTPRRWPSWPHRAAWSSGTTMAAPATSE
jgi:hypothetical protein